MFTGKVYVVTSLELVAAVQRHPKVLSFWYLEALFGKRLAAVSEGAASKLMDNVHRDQGEASLFDDGIKFLSKVLRPGEGLDGMNQTMIRSISASLDKFDAGLKNGRTIDLWEWIRYEMTMATTEATYGPLNPYRDPAVETAFWDLSEHASLLLLGFLPSMFARKGVVGRDKVTKAFEQYFTGKGQDQASSMTKGRYQITERHGISIKDMARFEGVQGITILANTVPSAFWIIFHELSRPGVLASVRQRAEELIVSNKTNDEAILKVGKLRDDPFSPPLLRRLFATKLLVRLPEW